jgi:hypothetical protein
VIKIFYNKSTIMGQNQLKQNFKFINESPEEYPSQYMYEIFEGRQIYKTRLDESLIIIHDEDKKIYHTANYEARNPFNDKEIEAYVKSYNENQ